MESPSRAQPDAGPRPRLEQVGGPGVETSSPSGGSRVRAATSWPVSPRTARSASAPTAHPVSLGGLSACTTSSTARRASPCSSAPTFAWSCGDGPLQRHHVRFNSATPLADVARGSWRAPSVVRGGSVGDGVAPAQHRRRAGDDRTGRGPVRLLPASHLPPRPECDGVVLEPGASCAVTVTVSTASDVWPAPEGYPLSLTATVDREPGVSGDLRVEGLPGARRRQSGGWGAPASAVALRLELGNAYRDAAVERLPGRASRRLGPGAEVARPGTLSEWTDWAAPTGATVTISSPPWRRVGSGPPRPPR